VKDPWWLYAYWETQAATERAALRGLLPHEVVGLQSVLRVHDVTGLPEPAGDVGRWFDISLSGLATNWYIQTNGPGRSFVADLGVRTSGGKFLRLARSNRVTAPRAQPCDVIDEAWAPPEAAWKVWAASVGVGTGASPGGWGQPMARREGAASWSSGALAGGWREGELARPLRCRVETDLVIHGTTEPRAAVTIDGQPAAVRKDGTFDLRLALPEGMHSLTIEVTSPDGRQTRTVTPIVNLAWVRTQTPPGPAPSAGARPMRRRAARPGGSP